MWGGKLIRIPEDLDGRTEHPRSLCLPVRTIPRSACQCSYRYRYQCCQIKQGFWFYLCGDGGDGYEDTRNQKKDYYISSITDVFLFFPVNFYFVVEYKRKTKQTCMLVRQIDRQKNMDTEGREREGIMKKK